MKYYYREHLDGYNKMKRSGVKSWNQVHGSVGGFEHFSSRSFLEDVLPTLGFEGKRPRALELGCGTGPGACFLAERGFEIDGIDLIPLAIDVAREAAKERNLDIRYEVMDVTQLPQIGPEYDLIVDSFCLQGIVLDSDRTDVFAAVRARLRPLGYYLVRTAMYESSRHHPEDQVVDPISGNVFHRYDDDDIFDPETDILYDLFSRTEFTELHDRPQDYDESIKVADEWYLPRRRYRTPEGLRSELESEGFRVHLQAGEFGENVVCSLAGSPDPVGKSKG